VVCYFKRYFEENGVFVLNPLDSSKPAFGSFKAVLDGEMKFLYSCGLGTSTKKAEPISPQEESTL
jgi:hypothetical protein